MLMTSRNNAIRNNHRLPIPLFPLLLAGSVLLLQACASVPGVGDVSAVKEANELAITCRTDEALAVVNRAVQSGGMAGAFGDLQRVVILRDAGRMTEAEAAMAARNRRWKVDAENAAEAERAVDESVAEMRAEREKRTGRRTCD
jgi:hypothetical protein